MSRPVNIVRPWLLRSPEPFVIICTCADGQTRTVKVGSNRRKWVECEEAIRDMRATNLEARDAKGHTLRMCELEGVEPDAAPAEPMPAPATPQGTDFALYARCLADAYKNGAASTLEPTRLAFETLGGLITAMTKRLDDLQAREVKQLNAALRAVQGEEVAPEEVPSWMGLLAQFAQGAQMGQAAQVAKNGAGHGGE